MRYCLLFCTLCLFTLSACVTAQKKQGPVPVIFDSDIGPDYDDVGAITILHVMEDKGEAKILATVASNKYEGIAAVLDLFNTYFGRPEIPIGVPKGEGVSLTDPQHWTDSLLAKYPHRVKRNADVPDAVKVYRKVLAGQPDHSVTVVTVGFLTNLAGLLDSKADEFSPLSGKELAARKIKQLVCMGGRYPSGKEFNIMKDAASSQKVFDSWPTPVIFSGFEIGAEIKTGLPLIHNTALSSPAKDAFSICIPQSPEDSAGRMSWDETTVLVAVRGYAPYYTLQPGKIKVASDGSNTWDKQGQGQFYLVKKTAPEKVQEVINDLMMQEPRRK
ncbi:nucleoside hydrolase [Compostibacter hankyongensis]|uniref:Nucleoside hydrolase n=1 Tax=Compostibacter hankyongensis TaxID=1007089 RepID=A0ABP8FTE4_9BACT